MAARELVEVRRVAPQQRGPLRRIVAPGARHDRVEDLGRNADVGHPKRSAARESLRRIVPELGAEERHREGCREGHAHHLAAVAVDAARHVDRDDGQAFGVDASDQPRCGALDRPVETRPEQRIDDQRPTRQRCRGEVAHRALPEARRPGGIALEGIGRAHQRDTHRPAGGLQQSRHHEAVAAVVAGAADHDHGLRPIVIGDGCDHGPSCRFHQLRAVGTGGDRGSVGLRHFRTAQQRELVAQHQIQQRWLVAHDALKAARATDAGD